MAAKENLKDPILLSLQQYDEARQHEAAEIAAYHAAGGKVQIPVHSVRKHEAVLQRLAGPARGHHHGVEVSRTDCHTCGAIFSSREALFRHIRKQGHGTFQRCTSLMSAILFDEWEAVKQLLAHGDGDYMYTAAELAAEEVDTGESPLLVATMKYILHIDAGELVRALVTLDVIKRLLALGADPHARPVQQRYLHRSALETVGGSTFNRIGRPETSKVAPRRVGEHLALWANKEPPNMFFRGSAAELACAVTADGRDAEICARLSALTATLGAPLADVPPIPSVTFHHWCPVCPKGAVLSAPHKQGAKQPARSRECDECGQFHSCDQCGLLWSKHSTAGGLKISCVEAICKPLIVGYYRHGYGPNLGYLQRALTILEHCPSGLVAGVKAALHAGKLHRNVARAQLNPDNNTRRAAIGLLRLYWPEEVVQCSICDDAYDECPPAQPVQQGNARFAKKICDHTFCAGCLTGWISTVVSAGRHKCFCPETGCTAQLYPDDIKRVAGVAVYAEYMAVLKTDHRGRLLEAMEAGVGLEKDPKCRACPACRVVIYRYEGCDDFVCHCGHRFHFSRATWPSVAALKGELAASG